MEKYSQYRDKGSGIAPFLPIAPPESGKLMVVLHIVLFCIRVPLVTLAWLVWLAIVQWTTPGNLLRQANLWCVLGIPGVWWIDIQVDGVRRGSLSQTPRGRLPIGGQIIASSFTSPLDVLYLAAIFDPIFTQSLPGTRLVRRVSIEMALASCFDVQPPPPFNKHGGAVELSALLKQNSNRIIVVFPESTTSNGRGILKLAPSLISAPETTKIFPISLRYTPADVVTPIPGWLEAGRFIWRLNSRQTHCIRVRIGAPLTIAGGGYVTSSPSTTAERPLSPPARQGYDSNFFDTLQTSRAEKVAGESESEDDLTENQRKALDAVADALARLGRVKRVDLGIEEKREFVSAWMRARKRK